MRLWGILFCLLTFTPSAFAADFKLSSRAFKKGDMIPAKYTCDAENISPPLEWGKVPRKTQSLVLIMNDPDAPSTDWVHWVIFDLPPSINNLPQAMPPLKQLANGEIHGQNDFKQLGYGGPCPPQGTHRYFFKLYALDTVLRLEPGTPANGVRQAMKDHIIAKGELMGRYQRAKG